MWDAGSVNVAKNVIDVCFAIIQYLLITIVIGFVVKKIVDKSLEKQKHIGENLSKYGIHKVSAHKGGTLNEKDKNVLFGKRGRVFPEEVDLCFLTGWSFFRDYCEELKNLVANGTKIRVLLGSPEGATFTGCQIEQTQKLLKKMTEYYANAYLNRSPLKSFLERETLMLAHENLADAENEETGRNGIAKRRRVRRRSYLPNLRDQQTAERTACICKRRRRNFAALLLRRIPNAHYYGKVSRRKEKRSENAFMDEYERPYPRNERFDQPILRGDRNETFPLYQRRAKIVRLSL